MNFNSVKLEGIRLYLISRAFNVYVYTIFANFDLITECTTLSPPISGNVSQSGTMVGAIADYSCEAGYQLTGSKSRFCAMTGNWTGTEPQCKPIGKSNFALPPLLNMHYFAISVPFQGTHVYECLSTICCFPLFVNKHNLRKYLSYLTVIENNIWCFHDMGNLSRRLG